MDFDWAFFILGVDNPKIPGKLYPTLEQQPIEDHTMNEIVRTDGGIDEINVGGVWMPIEMFRAKYSILDMEAWANVLYGDDAGLRVHNAIMVMPV